MTQHPLILLKGKLPALSFMIAMFLLACTFVNSALAQDNEGKLFTTAYEREYLDYLRRESRSQRANRGFNIENIPPPIIEQTTEETIQEAPVLYILGGIIEHSGNTFSLWLNGTLLNEEQLPDHLRIEKSQNGLVLRVQNQNTIFLLKPGQTLNLNTGVIVESFQTPVQSSVLENTSG